MNDDDDLVLALTPGAWRISLSVPFHALVATGMGIRYDIKWDGTSTGALWKETSIINEANVDAVWGDEQVQQHSNIRVGVNPEDFLFVEGCIIATSSSNLIFRWAQNSSNANNLVLRITASFVATKLS